MELSFDLKNIESNPEIDSYCRRAVEKIGRLLPKFPEDSVHLKINLERHPQREQFSSQFSLHLPDKIITASERNQDTIKSAIINCREEILRQVKRFKAELRKETHLRKAQKQAHWQT